MQRKYGQNIIIMLIIHTVNGVDNESNNNESHHKTLKRFRRLRRNNIQSHGGSQQSSSSPEVDEEKILHVTKLFEIKSSDIHPHPRRRIQQDRQQRRQNNKDNDLTQQSRYGTSDRKKMMRQHDNLEELPSSALNRLRTLMDFSSYEENDQELGNFLERILDDANSMSMPLRYF